MVQHVRGTFDRVDRVDPIWLWIDPTTRCNLACRLCYTKQSHGKLDLEPDELERVLARLAVSPSIEVKGIHLNWRGEPLMNPRFDKLLEITRRLLPDSPLQWHTNGTLLTQKRVDQILTVPVTHKIFVSLDGGNAISHDLNRGQGMFRKTMDGLRRLLDARGDDRTRATVGVYQIDLNQDEADYDPEFLELVARADDHQKVTPLLPGGVHHKVAEVADLESDEALHLRMSQDINPGQPIPAGACFWAGHTLCLAPDGQVSVCVISHGKAGVVGNLFSQPPETVVESAKAFRNRLDREGRACVGHCTTCRKPEGNVLPKHLLKRALTYSHAA
jgi:MoaA/NifB/PqqE/SkfB family radical SAM enzyme